MRGILKGLRNDEVEKKLALIPFNSSLMARA